MPKNVSKVSNDWEPYQDGRLWEFTHEEWEKMYPFRPMVNQIYGGVPEGFIQICWATKTHMYTRFSRYGEEYDLDAMMYNGEIPYNA